MNERTYYSQEAKAQAKREIALLVILALSVGGGIGTALALLLAPQKGEVLREEIAGTIEDRMTSMEKQVHELRKRVEDRITSMNH